MAVVRACDGLMQSKSVHAMRKDHVTREKFVEAKAGGGGRRLPAVHISGHASLGGDLDSAGRFADVEFV
jgi:hypothetical protein